MTFLLNPRFQTPADKGQIKGKFQNKGRQIKGKVYKNKGQIAVALLIICVHALYGSKNKRFKDAHAIENDNITSETEDFPLRFSEMRKLRQQL